IFGVAYWMFPRPLPQAFHGERLGWPTYWLLNTGLLLRIVGEGSRAAGREMNAVLVAAAMLQLIAGWSFVLLIWPPVRGREPLPRLSVWCLRTALLYLGLGFTLGAVMLAAPGLHLPATTLRLRPLHIELLLGGGMVTLPFGGAAWI